MSYIVPRTLVYQEFEENSSADIRERNAHISGGHAYLSRYAVSDEKASSLLGYYDPTDETCYSWPNKPAGAVVDQDYTKIWIEDALLKYHEDLFGAGYGSVRTVDGYRNRLLSDTVSYKDNGEDYPRHESLLRDVKIGDIVKTRAVVSSTEYIKWTYVKNILATQVASTRGSAVADDDNKATQSASSSYEQTAGAENCIIIDSTDHSTYTGLIDGDIQETYTVLVTEGSIDGDLTTATLRVTSASGRDNVLEVTPAAAGDPTEIGTRGLTATFDLDTGACSSESEDLNISSGDFIVGQTWEISVQQAFTKPTGTSAGTYTGTKDDTYIVEVTRGGLYAGDTKPQITVTTSNGTDVSGPTTITAASTAFSVGTHDVTIAFNTTGLCKGDKYSIEVTAETDGEFNILVLGHNLDENIPATEDVDLTLYIKKTVQITENRVENAPEVNWEPSATTICLKSGITAFDSSWVDEDGEEQPLEVESSSTKGYGKAYVEYRAWRSELVGQTDSITDVGDIDDAIAGALTPDNNLKWGVYKAVINSNGTAVRYQAVTDPAVTEDWLDVLEVLKGHDDVYGLVPLTRNGDVLDAYFGHVKAMSTAENARWRMLWVNLSSPSSKAIVDATTSSDEEVVLATVTEDTGNELSGAQYTLVTITSDNADLSDLEVRAGDIARIQFTTDGFDNVTYTDYVIDDVLNSDSFLLQSGPDAAINVASKIEIWRNLTPTARAEALAVDAGTYGHRRVCAVWPDTIGSNGTSQEGYYLCAALAGLVSGIVPHQGLTRLEIAGFDDVSRTLGLFNDTQLDLLGGGGVFVVTQNRKTGQIYSRHAVTTADYDVIEDREEMFVRNLDSVSYSFADTYEPYIGVSNVTPSLLDQLEAETLSNIQFLRQANFTPRLGGQIIDGEIVELRASPVFADRTIVRLRLSLPQANNNIETHIMV